MNELRNQLSQAGAETIADLMLREVLVRTHDIIAELGLFKGFKHFEVTFAKAEANFKLIHNFGFLPKDILVTSTMGDGTIIVNQGLTTAEVINLTASAACVVRFIAGTFQERAV